MRSRRALLPAIVCLALCALAPAASASTTFHPRIRGALGLAPPIGAQPDIASGLQTPVTYHGGSVMTGGITVHTIFWTGGTNPFQGQPTGAPHNYIGMVQQFFTDTAHASGGTSNVFSTLPQFAKGTTPGAITPGSYSISYNPATDSIADSTPYPPKSDQCASPQSASVCVTDAQIQAEVNRVITATHGNRGLHDLWYVFLPPDVDECILPGECGTNAFGGYHSLSNIGHGLTIYALTIDPIIETQRNARPGNDPEGYPDAEHTIDIAAHETVEAMTDPEGLGYMDPNGFETADKCEFGPQLGTPLGFAGPDHAPFNQVINGHDYLVQEMWANHDNSGNPDCVQRTTNTKNDLPLPQVAMSQFSATVSGNTERGAGGTTVTVSLIRAAADGSPVTVAQGSTTSSSDGSWSVSLAPHAVGDDRDEIDVDYSGPNAPSPHHQVILTGNGGNPFGEAGWTGWTDLDNGANLANDSLTLAPCFQTGVFHATSDGASLTPGGSPTDFCNTQTDSTTVGGAFGPGNAVTQGSLDNRAFQDPNLPTANPVGALVDLTVPVGEPNAVSTFSNPLPTFAPSGFPTCTADLQADTVSCSGLVSGESYTVRDGRSGDSHSGAADGTGTVSVNFATGAIHGGDAMSLSNGSRTATVLHVAHLRVDITGQQSVLAAGSCEPDDYFAGPLGSAPTNASAGDPTAIAGGSALTDAICPSNGDASGFSSSNIVQTDERSGGQTMTHVPDVEDTSPMQGEIVYGNFTALAESGLPGPNNSISFTDSTTQIALTIQHSSGGAPVFHANNVDTAGGVAVNGLSPGTYRAIWILRDSNGDTRMVITRFVEEPGSAAKRHHKASGPKVSCKRLAHRKLSCSVIYKNRSTKGTLRMRLGRPGHVAALGSGKVRHGKAKLVLRELRRVRPGTWSVTLVLSQSHHRSSTTHTHARVR